MAVDSSKSMGEPHPWYAFLQSYRDHKKILTSPVASAVNLLSVITLNIIELFHNSFMELGCNLN